MNNRKKLLSILALAALLALTVAAPAHAFDGREGDKIVIAAGEVVDDDLYVTADEFILDGTVKGDVLSVGRITTINGTIEGSLMAAAQAVVVNGTVKGDIRMSGYVLQLGEKASIEGDIVAAGYSLEVRKGSSIGRDVVFAGAQILMAGDVARNMQVATGAFALNGTVGGNVKADVAEAGQGGPPPMIFMPQSPVAAPTVKEGLTIDPGARIAGNLQYVQSKDLTFPAGVVAGKVTRKAPVANSSVQRQETAAEKVSKWFFKLGRDLITFILVGLLLLWLFPFFMRGLSDKLQSKPWRSLGWGLLSYVAFFFLLMVIIAVTILAGLVFGILTLGGLAGAAVWLGLFSLFALILGFVLVTAFVAKIVFGQALGRWILTRAHSPLAEHRYWPMIVGLVITIVVIAVLSFPLIPAALGWLLDVLVVLAGLGTLWLWYRERRVTPAAVG